MGLIDTLLAQLVADRDAIKSALNGILGVSVGDSMADYATPITTVGHQLEGMLGIDQEFSIDLTGSGLTILRIGMFSDCVGLTSIIIPEGITTISTYAFRSCRGLSKLELPSTVTAIQGSTFTACTNLEYIKIYAVTPPSLTNSNAFTNTNDCPIYVPADSVAAYKAASNWNSLSSRIQAIPS